MLAARGLRGYVIQIFESVLPVFGNRRTAAIRLAGLKYLLPLLPLLRLRSSHSAAASLSLCISGQRRMTAKMSTSGLKAIALLLKVWVLLDIRPVQN